MGLIYPVFLGIDLDDGPLLGSGVLGPAAEGGHTVPAEGHHGEGEDQPGGPEGQGVQTAERQSDLPFSSGEGVAHVDSRYGLDKKRDDQIRKANIGGGTACQHNKMN